MLSSNSPLKLYSIWGELLFLNSSWGTHELSWVAECRLANLSWPPNSPCKLNQGICHSMQGMREKRHEREEISMLLYHRMCELTLSLPAQLNSSWVQSQLKLNIECMFECLLINSTQWPWVEFRGGALEFVLSLTILWKQDFCSKIEPTPTKLLPL